jgi:hypothetical protein
MDEIRKKIVACHIGGVISDDGHIQEVRPGWTWIVEPEGYAECIDVKDLIGKTLKIISVDEMDVVMEIL